MPAPLRRNATFARTVHAAVTVAVLALVAGCSSADRAQGVTASSTTGSSTTAAPTTTRAAYRSEIYGQSRNWLCRPDTSDDACDVELDSTLLAADGTATAEPFRPAADPSADCFYVYPTISTDKEANSDLNAGPEERTVVANQFARFAAACRLFAPVYRQVPLAGIGFSSGATTTTVPGARPAREIAYGDVRDAWRHYLANDNDGRPVVLIGHSQGAGHLLRLLAEEIDPDARFRKEQLLSAMLIGAGVPASGTSTALKNIPPCDTARATGCVISFASFLDTEPPPADSYFGTQRRGSAGRVICTNPGALGGSGAGALNSYFPAQPEQKVATKWVHYRGLYEGTCATNRQFDWLSIRSTAGAGDARPSDPGGRISPQWGLHLIDMNLTLGNLIDLVRTQTAALNKG